MQPGLIMEQHDLPRGISGYLGVTASHFELAVLASKFQHLKEV